MERHLSFLFRARVLASTRARIRFFFPPRRENEGGGRPKRENGKLGAMVFARARDAKRVVGDYECNV